MRRTLTVAALLLLAAGPASAQYFGQNKVQYRTFDFKIIQTEHFEVYYYDQERAAALDAARMAERAYARMSRVLHHQFQGRKPIILYASHSDFQQTNAIQGELGEGTGGVTEFFKHRMVLPFTGSYADLEHVLQHEMAHQFQYDVYSRGRIGAGVQTLINVNPPGWFMEGMAEYLSVGPIDPHTAMWLRDAALEGNLPTIEQMTYDPRVFPYRFGHALWSYIGEKWGDEVIGEILQTSATSGIEGAFRRALGLSLEELSDEWIDAIQTTYLPQLADHYRARRIAQPALTQRRSGGTVHLAPALSPDGREIVYFSERNTFFINLYLADVETGRVKRQLAKSGFSTNYESLRFINSAGTWSPDGRYFAIAVKRKERDDLVIIDVRKGREERRIRVPLSGLATPSWSPDGQRLVFTGFDGGVSDLFIVNRDGSDLRRLTNDTYADFQPSWSPDGKTIAFATDRSAATDFEQLRFGNMRIALYHLGTGSIELLGHMEEGKNINPVWAPDGRSLAFVSDRTGISNIFLADLTDGTVYQLTNVYTGVSGITALSPTLSWAAKSDRLAFAYYENGDFTIYTLENPRSLRHGVYQPRAQPVVVSSLLSVARSDTTAVAVTQPAPATPSAAGGQPGEATSVYRSASGFRASESPQPAESTTATGPISVRTLLDSVALALPDTTQFTFRRYRTRFTPDYIARPTVGYQRDNFGRGFFGGTAISLSDILGNRTLVFAGALNGRLSEAQFLGVYINQSRRLNWAAGFSQTPLYFYAPSTVRVIDAGNAGGADSAVEFTARLRRFVIRDVFGEAYYPFSRFSRLELGVHTVNITDATLELSDYYDNVSGGYITSDIRTVNGPSISYVQPSLALVYDKTLFGYVGPFAGARSRFEIAPSFGTWQFVTGLTDYRRYLFARPFTLAFRTVFFGRFGRDADRFPLFLGNTELMRGYTAGSFRDNECVAAATSTSRTGCAELDQLVGSKLAVANVELRFPLARNVIFGFLPIGLPPIEGALFYDVGLAWDENSTVKWSRRPGENPDLVRAPLRSYGASIRANMLGFLILRFDYTKPLDRPRDRSYWTVSLGPTF
ncbi:MAG: PD40 domain-containing protein [Gemmatimonadetes bacterium]|nr:PD40 domain-containing protein [Gemmatimonadota bacterium]